MATKMVASSKCNLKIACDKASHLLALLVYTLNEIRLFYNLINLNLSHTMAVNIHLTSLTMFILKYKSYAFMHPIMTIHVIVLTI